MRLLLMYSTHRPSLRHVKRLGDLRSGIEVTVAGDEPTAIAAAAAAEVVVGHRYLRQALPHASALRWVQSTAGGVDRLPCKELAARQVTLTRMTAASDTIAQHALTMAWSITRCLPSAWQRQRQGLWDPTFEWLPWPRRAIVFGVGTIGRAIAHRLKQDSIAVTGVRRDTTAPPPAEFDDIAGPDSWRERLPGVDWCFLALPDTGHSRNLIDEAALRALPATAVLVNVGRGEAVATEDLCRVLADGHLGGAALDVVEPKPRDPADPIWQTPRLMITPYVAAHSRERPEQIERFVEAQLARYLAGEPLLEQVKLDEFG